MKTKYEYEKPAVQLLFTQNLMEGEPGIHFGSGELNGDDEGEVLSQHIAEAIGYRNLDRGDWAERVV